MKYRLRLSNYLIIFILLPFIYLNAQKMHSDNGDGTYTNPVIYSDFPDPDVIRVDSAYYMISTTMFIFPGVTILKSYDLVNWEYCVNAVPKMDYSSCFNLDGCNRYSHGQWASSLKYNNGKFYIIFNTLDDGGFLCAATKAEGPWEIKKLKRGFHDPGLFFDEDGKIYIAHGYGSITITELDTNFAPKGNDVLVFTGDIRGGLEGAHVYKINGYYYLYCTYGGGDGFQVALRSKNIYGPYEEKIVINDTGNLTTGLHQGALIETTEGEWWTIIFQDGGAFGRFPTLQPVTWVDDWPMVGVNGKGVGTYKKPNVGKEYPVKILPTSDEFEENELGMQWGWNHNPDSTNWSLKENPGYLRLSTAKIAATLPEARNTLTQRIFAYYSTKVISVVAAKMDFENMKDGDIAGLAVFQAPYAFIGVKKTNGINYTVMVNNGQVIDSIIINGSTVYFRADAYYGTSEVYFYYSLDNNLFKPLGNKLLMQFNLSIFTGNKFCLFNYPTKETGGYVDFDWFRTNMEPVDNRNAVWLEAECGNVGSKWNTSSDTSASNSSYVVFQSGNNDTLNVPTNEDAYISFSFDVKQMKSFYLDARILSSSENGSSIWVKMDNTAWVAWNNITANTWDWKQFPGKFNLRQGKHSLTLAYREDGLQLDKIKLSATADIPSGTGEAAENLCIITSIGDDELNKAVLPAQFELMQNYPNPFNPVTNIFYTLPQNSDVNLVIYDATGRRVATLVNETQSAGEYKVVFNAGNYSSGVFFYQLRVNSMTITKSMLLLK